MAGTQIQMIGIAQDNLSAAVSQIFRAQGFNRSLRAHRHKGGCINCAVRGDHFSQTCGCLLIFLDQFK